MVPWKWMLVAAADMEPLQALLVLVAGVSFEERVMFMPAMSVGGVRLAGRLFWK